MSCFSLKTLSAYAGAGPRGNCTTHDETRFLCIRKPSNYDAMVYAQPPESVRLWLSETTPRGVSRRGVSRRGVSRRVVSRRVAVTAGARSRVPRRNRAFPRRGSLLVARRAHTRVPPHLVAFKVVVAW